MVITLEPQRRQERKEKSKNFFWFQTQEAGFKVLPFLASFAPLRFNGLCFQFSVSAVPKVLR
jgi:hypothetical protein